MGDLPSRTVSRRRWLGAASLPLVAATLLDQSARAADDAGPGAPANPHLAGARVYNIRDYGAKGDATTLDTDAIQSAIDACTKDQGGTVLVPAGTFLIGPIELKSNVTLHIVAAGKLLGTTDVTKYQPANGIPLRGDWTMGDGNVGLVYAANAENVTIEGAGTIDGQGTQVRAAGSSGNRRPHLSLFYKCTNLTIRDVFMFQSAYHTCRICNSSYVHLDGVRIHSRGVSNNDGFHFISAEHVHMSNCNVRCQDDACALFGSCRFITVTNSSFSTRWSVFRFGGGNVENIAVSNCLMYQVFGCPIKIRCAPGSVYENMSFSNLVFEEVTGPISIGAGPQRPGGAPRPAAVAAEGAPDGATANPQTAAAGLATGAIVRNVTFSNISGTVTTKQGTLGDSGVKSGNNPGELHSCIILNCVEGNTIENVSLSNIQLTFGGGGTAEDAARREIPPIAAEYFALGAMPAYGLFARNVHGLSLDNIRLQVATPDLRPAVILDRVQDVAILGLSAQGNPEAELLRFTNTSDTLITAPRVLAGAAAFLRVEGSQSHGIIVDGGDISKAAKPLDFADGAADTSVKLRA
jgi:hypothetical protein